MATDRDPMQGRRRLGERAEGFADRQAEAFSDRPKRTALKWFLGLLAVIAVVGIIGGVFGLFGAWFGETKRLAGPQHSREQVTAVLDLSTSMEATAGNVCGAVNSRSTQDSPTLVEDPAFAYKAMYRKLKAEYDRRMGNFFEAAVTRKLPIPAAIGGLPKRAPTLEEAMAAAGC